MRFAIRDDDTAFFTSPRDLESAYGFIQDPKISLSVVPQTVTVHNIVKPYNLEQDGKYYPIHNNKELVTYLRKGIKDDRYEILLHGYSHEYRMMNNRWIPEMIWKDYNQLELELKRGKEYLEETLGTSISIFVAPNNAINQKAIRVIEEIGLDYSGIIQHIDRDINIFYVRNYIYRWAYRLIKGVQYGGVLDYGGHKELNAYSLQDFNRLVKEYHLCKEKMNPFVIFTHYWDINRNKENRQLLERIISYVLDDGAEMSFLSDCFKEDYKCR